MSDRFGRPAEYPKQLEFVNWGVTRTVDDALDAFEDAHDYFDRQDVRLAEMRRGEMIRAARRYYDGNHVKPLKVEPGEPDRSLLVNLCRAMIDQSVGWLVGDPKSGALKIDVAAAPGRGDADIEQAGRVLEQVYVSSGGFKFLERMVRRGSQAGHFFIRIQPRGEGELPRLVALDPLLCSVRTDPSDSDQVIAYKIEFRKEVPAPGSRRRELRIHRQLAVELPGQAWAVADFTARNTLPRQWVLAGGPWAWPWKWPPIVDGPNILHGWDYYGLSDLEDIAGLNDAINFLGSNTLQIIKYHAHPKTIGSGLSIGDLLSSDAGAVWTVEDPEARIYNLEMRSNLESSLRMIALLSNAFWTIGRGVDPNITSDRTIQLTNFGLRVLAIRAIQKAGDKRLTYGDALRECNRRVLEMQGVPGATTVLRWPRSMPESRAELIERLDHEVAMGITSQQTAAEDAGRSWSAERARIWAEKVQRQRRTLGEVVLNGITRAGALSR